MSSANCSLGLMSRDTVLAHAHASPPDTVSGFTPTRCQPLLPTPASPENTASSPSGLPSPIYHTRPYHHPNTSSTLNSNTKPRKEDHNAPLPLPPRCPDGPRGRPEHRHRSLHIDRDNHRDGVCPALLNRVGRHVHDDDRDAIGDAGCFAYVEYAPIFLPPPPPALLACIARRVLLAGDGWLTASVAYTETAYTGMATATVVPVSGANAVKVNAASVVGVLVACVLGIALL